MSRSSRAAAARLPQRPRRGKQHAQFRSARGLPHRADERAAPGHLSLHRNGPRGGGRERPSRQARGAFPRRGATCARPSSKPSAARWKAIARAGRRRFHAAAPPPPPKSPLRQSRRLRRSPLIPEREQRRAAGTIGRSSPLSRRDARQPLEPAASGDRRAARASHPPPAHQHPAGPPRDFSILGVLGKLYVLMENASGLVLVDQHAAHERILFEEMRRRMEAQGVPTQRLLLPLTLQVTPRDADWIARHLDVLHRAGIGAGAIRRRHVQDRQRCPPSFAPPIPRSSSARSSTTSAKPARKPPSSGSAKT